MEAPRSENDAARLRALQRYHVLDTAHEAAFDRITQLAARLFEVPIALVSLVDENRLWWKSCVGLDGYESPRDSSICAHAILSFDPFVIEDTTQDPRFRENPAVTGPPSVRFYAGAPLTSEDGYNLGTLCIVDTRPRTLTPAQVETLVDLSRVVVDELELRLAYRTRALFQKVCEMSPSLIYIYERAKHERTFLGRNLLGTLGYDASLSASDLLPKIVHPEDLPHLYRYLDQLDVLEQGPIELSYRVRDVAGHWHWFLAKEALFDRDEQGRVSQVLGITTDVTQLKATELRLEESEELLAERVRVLEGILDSAGEGIVVADETGRFTVFNPTAQRIVGESPPIGARVYDGQNYTLLDPETHQPLPTHELPLGLAIRGEPSDNLELLVRTASDVETLIRVTGRPLKDTAGNTRGGIITFNDVTQLRAAEAELARRAVTDALTGLPNRRAFDERLALLVAEGSRGRQFALVLGDLDHFKKVNDSHGHAVGDAVLAHVGQVLSKGVRCTDFVARYGGEEFCVLFSDVDETLATRLADNLRRAVASEKGPVPVTFSFGVCVNRPNERTDPSALLQAADRALYAAKSQGRNRVVTGQLSKHESIPIVSPQAKARA